MHPAADLLTGSLGAPLMRLASSLHAALLPQGTENAPAEPIPQTPPGGPGTTPPPGGGPAGQPGMPCGTQELLLFGGMILIFYFLILRPQQRQEKMRRAMLAALKKGDRVVTTGGVHATVVAIGDDTVELKLDPEGRLKMTVDRVAIARITRERKEEIPTVS